MPASLEDLSTDQLIATARTTGASHELLQSMLRDPSTREMVQRHVKKIDPNRPIPELDARDAMSASLAEERSARQELERKILERDVRERMEKLRAATASKYRFSDADMLEVEKLMTAEVDAIPTYDAAARVHAAQKMTATPTHSSIAPPTFEMPEKDVWAGGIGNKAKLDKIAMNEAYAALNDIRSGKVAGLGPAVGN